MRWVVVLVLASAAHAGPVLHVDDDAGAGGDGLAWATAFAHLQDALAAASNRSAGVTEIRVAQGSHFPDRDESNPLGTGNRTATFNLIDAVTLRGGYAGIGGPDPDARDVAAYPTILSGDLLGDDQPGFVNNGDNSIHVVAATFSNASGTLDGFTIRGGNADSGGGLYVFQGAASGPTVIDCIFEQNSATEGGGIFNRGSVIEVTECRFTGNHAGSRGGGINIFSGSATITGCVFTGNTSNEGAGAHLGSSTGLNNATISGCTFELNEAVQRGGGLYIAGTGQDLFIDSCSFVGNSSDDNGGGVFCNGGRPIFTDCLFDGNAAVDDGGGLHMAYEIEASNCVLRNNVAGRNGGGAYVDTDDAFFINSLFMANSAGQYGGGICTVDALDVILCTFGYNTSTFEGGGLCSFGSNSNPNVVNNIFRNNSDGTAEVESGQLASVFLGNLAVSYCCIQGLTGALGGAGNIGDNPMFVDDDGLDDTAGTDDDDLRLQPGSPCIDAGDNTVVPPPITTDLGDNPRFSDDPDTPNTGNPGGQNAPVDMGPYEYQAPCPWDLDRDGFVGILDFLALLAAWGTDPGGPPDFDGDGDVGVNDFLELLANWGPCP